MRAIRKVIPAAKLVQTEDLGKVFSTPRLAYQAEYENQRRWLSLDLLAGRVDRTHPWRKTFIRHGISEADLDLFLEGEAMPDIIGINYYATSERYLDEALHLYPQCFHGRNTRERYADVEAVRVDLPEGELGARARLRRSMGALRHSHRRDRGAPWLHARGTGALAGGCVAGRRGPPAAKAATSAR